MESRHDLSTEESKMRVLSALADAPDADELVPFWLGICQREDLYLMVTCMGILSDDSIRRAVRIIKGIEDKESSSTNGGVHENYSPETSTATE